MIDFFNEHVETGKREGQVREVQRVILEVKACGAELAQTTSTRRLRFLRV